MKSCLLLPLSHLLLIALPFLPLFSHSQKKFSFEKVTLDEMTMKRCPFDTAAGTMVLGDVGTPHFDWMTVNWPSYSSLFLLSS